jgi:hypothetical protein
MGAWCAGLYRCAESWQEGTGGENEDVSVKTVDALRMKDARG